jgi:hypothetical protein
VASGDKPQFWPAGSYEFSGDDSCGSRSFRVVDGRLVEILPARPKLTYNPTPPELEQAKWEARGLGRLMGRTSMDTMTALDLNAIEARLDAFGEWFLRVVEGAGYDRSAAIEDWEMLDRDQRRLLEQARARAI